MKTKVITAAIAIFLPLSASSATSSELSETMMAAQIGTALELGLVFGIRPEVTLAFTTQTNADLGTFSYALTNTEFQGAPIYLTVEGLYSAPSDTYLITGSASALGLGSSISSGTGNWNTDKTQSTFVSTIDIGGVKHTFTRYENYKYDSNGTSSTFSAVYTRSGDGHEQYLAGKDKYTGDGKYVETVIIGDSEFKISGFTPPGGVGEGQFTMTVSAVPESSTYALFFAGLLSFICIRKGQQSRTLVNA